MITRRLLVAAALASAATPALAEPADAARDLIVQLGSRLTQVANGADTADARRAALEKLIVTAVDIEAVARFCLGRFWRTATPDEQRDYTQLFRAVMIRNITGKAGEYKGVGMDIGKAAPREEDVAVSSTVTRPGSPASKVDWIVSAASGTPRIIDVIAEGTSLRLTQRSDYAAFMASHGNKVQALIEAMKAQAN